MTFGKFRNRSRKSAQQSDETVPFLVRRQDEEVGVDRIKRASFAGSVFNLSCTIVGSGIMSLPAAVKVLGVIPGVLLIIIAGFLAEVSIELLIRFSNEAAALSYADVMESAFGRVGRFLLQISVVVNNIGVLITYLIIIGVNSVLLLLSYISSSRICTIVHTVFLLISIGIMSWKSDCFSTDYLIRGCAFRLNIEWGSSPWCSWRVVWRTLVDRTGICADCPYTYRINSDSLKYTSALSVAMACVFIVAVVGITAYKLTKGTIKETIWFPSISSLSAFFNLFTAVPVLVCAFLCHYNGLQSDLLPFCFIDVNLQLFTCFHFILHRRSGVIT
ncbi:hypothetical protein Ancab_006491 [Ancistrocladus abbreviatus]